MSNYFPDQSVSSKDDDHFQRFQFSKRIANTIAENDSEEGYVIGVYGKWGEGKTSVLKFIESELKGNPGIVILNFNPWRFGDETALITSFFTALAQVLKEKLFTVREKFLGFVKNNEPLFEGAPELIQDILDYSRTSASFVGPLTGFVGNIAKGGKSKSEVSIDTLKGRIEKLLVKNKKRILVIIDDIDRLDADEIRAIFRLVKLTAHFKYTTYVLAFDDNQVANVLAKSFGDIDPATGYLYLEKIIQVPLKLPVARIADMQTYLMDKLGEMVHEYSLDHEELERLNTLVVEGLLPAMRTPRMIIRFINACYFSLPLMNKLVNHVDMVAIEGLKIMYPRLYDLISKNKRSIVSVPGSRVIGMTDSYFNDFKKDIEEALSKCEASARLLIVNLFPELAKLLGSEIMSSEDKLADIQTDMRVCSHGFFERYFSYSVAKGDLSEIILTEKLDILDENRTSNGRIINELFNEYGVEEVLLKVTNRYKKLSNETAEKLLIALIDLAQYYPRDIHEHTPYRLPERAADLVLDIIETLPLNFRKKLFERAVMESKPLEFGITILRLSLRRKDATYAEGDTLSIKFLNAIIDSVSKSELIGRLPLDTRWLLHVWAVHDRKALNEYLGKLFHENASQVLRLIKAFTPYRLESSGHEIAFVNFGQDNFNQMSNMLDVEIVAKNIVSSFGSDYGKGKLKMVDDIFETNNDEILLDQFMWFYANHRIKDKA